MSYIILISTQNNNVFGYRDSNDNNIYCVYCKVLYQIYNTLSYQYISLNKRLKHFIVRLNPSLGSNC